MSFEFQSTLVDVTPNYRISGANIGGAAIEYNGGVKVLRVIVTNDADVKFALSGPYESGDPDAIYAALAVELYELTPGILINEGAVSSVELSASEIKIDLIGSDLKYVVRLNGDLDEAKEIADHTWELPSVGFGLLSAAASSWRSSLDETLGGLNGAIVAVQADVDQNEADADAAIAAEIARVDALIASDMWLFADKLRSPCS